MQRWWFLDDKGKSSTSTSEYSIPIRSIETIEKEKERKWQFRVLVTQSLNKYEKIAITGDCPTLGDWIPQHCVFMNNDDANVWSCEISIPLDKEVFYRYFIYTIDPLTEHVHVRRWETHFTPRQIPPYEEQSSIAGDLFGELDGQEKIDSGWLTTETIIQFKFFDNPFQLKEKLKNRLLYVKVTPLNLRSSESSSSIVSAQEESLSNDTRENSSDSQPAYAFAEVVTLKYPTSQIEMQEQFGRAYNPNDVLIFNVTVSEPDNVAYLIDLYTYSSKVAPDGPPYHLGYHYILPNCLRRSDGVLQMPITCTTRHRPLGMMHVEYLKIAPLKSHVMNMKISYSRYWNKLWTGLDVGHRGLGPSFKPSKITEGHSIRENTIASMKSAVESGADMVEFDVQLSKDMVPVIYHDFEVCVSLKRKKALDANDMLELPMCELTMEQLRNLKVYHVAEGRSREPKFFDEDLDDHQPFPQLADVFDAIDENVGFNIEVKWSMQLKDGTKELNIVTDRNQYVDRILDVVFAKAGMRRIVFSCFDPDICTMLRYKQNVYPVMFLTIGVTEKYPDYHDPRCNSIEGAVSNAYAMELLGIVAHTEDLLRDSTRIKIATDLGLIVFCWGDDNNSQDTIKLLKSLGIHGVIYDKMDILSTKEEKKSIFLLNGKEPQKDILRIQKLEHKMHQSTAKELTDIIGTSDDILKIEASRDMLALSTASSLESIDTHDL